MVNERVNQVGLRLKVIVKGAMSEACRFHDLRYANTFKANALDQAGCFIKDSLMFGCCLGGCVTQTELPVGRSKCSSSNTRLNGPRQMSS
jgi:hypothetical protein